jgi:flagellar hook assembly protein FlgD
VFDLVGREVRTLINNEERPAGDGVAVWDGRNNVGRPVTTGAYFYTLKFGNFEKTNKMLLVK